jgi:hypothetical protein
MVCERSSGREGRKVARGAAKDGGSRVMTNEEEEKGWGGKGGDLRTCHP